MIFSKKPVQKTFGPAIPEGSDPQTGNPAVNHALADFGEEIIQPLADNLN